MAILTAMRVLLENLKCSLCNYGSKARHVTQRGINSSEAWTSKFDTTGKYSASGQFDPARLKTVAPKGPPPTDWTEQSKIVKHIILPGGHPN